LEFGVRDAQLRTFGEGLRNSKNELGDKKEQVE
jgi:hypothetical protein